MNEAAKKERLWNNDFIIVMIACSGISFCNYFFSSTLPIYAKNLTGTTVYAGLIMTAYTLSALATRPFTGILADRIGRVKLLILGAVLCVIASLLYNLAGVISILIYVRILHGMGFGIHSTSGGTVAADVIPKARMSEGLGIFGLYGTLASALAPGIALSIIGDGALSDFKALFIVAAAVSLLSLILDCFIKYEKKSKAPAHEHNDSKKADEYAAPLPKAILGFEYGVFLPAAVIILIFLGFGSITSFITLFAQERELGNIGLFFTVNAIGMFISRFFLGKVADRRGADIVVIPALAALIFCFALIPSIRSSAVLFILAFPLGFAQGAVCPAMNTMIFRRCSPRRRGTASASYFSSIDLGLGLGALIHGIIADTLSYNFVYWAAALFSALALIIYLFGIIPSNRKLGL